MGILDIFKRNGASVPPRRGRRRRIIGSLLESWDHIYQGFKQAQRHRIRAWFDELRRLGVGADWHYANETEFLRMIELAREFERSHPLISQAISRVVDNVMQDGMRLDPKTGDPDVDTDILDGWSSWATDPDRVDIAGRFNFHDVARLALRSEIRDGDTFIILHAADQVLEVVEAHRCRTPPGMTEGMVHGVRLDDARMPIEYWFAREAVSLSVRDQLRGQDFVGVEARDADGNRVVLHIYDPKRFSQSRGISALAPVFDITALHDDIQFCKSVQQKSCSAWALLIEQESDYVGLGTSRRFGAISTQTASDGTPEILEEIAPGLIYRAEPGEKLSGFSPNVPNPEFFDHAMLMVTYIAVNLNLPVQVLLLDPTKTNFSGWRGAIDQARFGFREIQRRMIERLYEPVYEWHLRNRLRSDEAFARRVRRAGVNVFSHRWIPPRWQYIEPLKDVTADVVRIANRLSSPRRVLAERGLDIDEVRREIIEDNTRAIAAAMEAADRLNREFPGTTPVDWREILAMPLPQGFRAAIDIANQTAPEANNA